MRCLAVSRSTFRGGAGAVGDGGVAGAVKALGVGDDGVDGVDGVDGDTPFTLLKSQFNFGLRILCTKSRPEPR